MKYLITGLGNIGPEYTATRHNIGFMVADRLAEKLGVSPLPDRYASIATGKYRGRTLVIAWPATYMNLSGKAVRYHLENQKLDRSRLLVITDDIALPFGRLRLKPKGSDGGHNGLKHIQEVLGSNQYARLRVGVGDDFPPGQQVDYVLAPFSAEEQAALPEVIDRCVEGILAFVAIGIERSMNEVNRK